jgi:hypothetical protein
MKRTKADLEKIIIKLMEYITLQRECIDKQDGLVRLLEERNADFRESNRKLQVRLTKMGKEIMKR